jgi:hypothetical protein
MFTRKRVSFVIVAVVMCVAAATVLAIVMPLTLENKNVTQQIIKVKAQNAIKRVRLNQNPVLRNQSVACCMAVRNCAAHLPQIFDNLDSLRKHFLGFHCIFVYDNCSDNTADVLLWYAQRVPNVTVVHNSSNTSPLRTVRIASSRNMCIAILEKGLPFADFHFMIDTDDVNDNAWNVDFIVSCLDKPHWDCLSFNANNYYDAWTLFYGPFKHHCWGFKHKNKTADSLGYKIIKHMLRTFQQDIGRLKGTDNLFPVLAAFNGFAIYRTPVFRGLKHDGLYKNIRPFFTDQDRQNTLSYFRTQLGMPHLELNEDFVQHCDHLFYQLSGIKEKGARIRVSPESHFL